MFGDYHNPNDYWQHNGYDQYKDMNPDERMAAGCLQGAAFFAMLLVGILLCALFGSCKSVEYVTVEKVKHDTTYISKWQRDSIYIHDSTFIKEKGDSILVERWHTAYRDRWRHDTIVRIMIDSIPKPYPVIKMVERELTKTEKGLMFIGGLAVMAVIVWLAVKVKRWLPLR